MFKVINGALDKDHIALVKEASDKSLNEHEMDLQEFIINGFNRTKLASMIYGVSRSKWEGLGYSQKYFNPRFEILSKPTNASSSSSAKKGLNSYFVPAVKNAKVLNQSEPKVAESKKGFEETKTYDSKVKGSEEAKA